jgi:GAF domain-containing protein
MLARWSKLEQVIEDLKEADSIEEVVQTIRISARAIAGADGIAFVRREGDHVHYVTEDAIGPLWTGQHFPIESCISGIAMITGEPVVIPDVFADPRVPHAAYEPTFVKSMAMFPLGLNGKVAAIGGPRRLCPRFARHRRTVGCARPGRRHPSHRYAGSG